MEFLVAIVRDPARAVADILVVPEQRGTSGTVESIGGGVWSGAAKRASKVFRHAVAVLTDSERTSIADGGLFKPTGAAVAEAEAAAAAASTARERKFEEWVGAKEDARAAAAAAAREAAAK